MIANVNRLKKFVEREDSSDSAQTEEYDVVDEMIDVETEVYFMETEALDDKSEDAHNGDSDAQPTAQVREKRTVRMPCRYDDYRLFQISQNK